ncbi:MAG: nucleotidyltransferase domain-containing protein [Bacteroidales bacterium]|nr:nucleotidyltransferase domain-containing protein [Bacteroidales bacterium]
MLYTCEMVMEQKEFLYKIKKSVIQREPKAEVYLFGSRARNDNRIASDWDILILTEKANVTNEVDDNFRDKLYDLELETGEIISILIYPKNYWHSEMQFSPLYQNIKKEGIRL